MQGRSEGEKRSYVAAEARKSQKVSLTQPVDILPYQNTIDDSRGPVTKEKITSSSSATSMSMFCSIPLSKDVCKL